MEKLQKQAVELGIEITDGMTLEEVQGLVKDAILAKKQQKPASSHIEPAAEGEGVFEDGVRVKAILNDGKETETHYHCSMENGTTMHVPKSKFKVS